MELEAKSLMPITKVIKTFTDKAQARAAEGIVIATARQLGFDLLNVMTRHHADETRAKMSRSHGGRTVVDETGMVFESAEDAARFHGINSGGVSAVLRGKCRTFKGRTFRFA